MALNREQILAAIDCRLIEEHVPEWGGSVWLRTMTGTERDQFEAESLKRKGKDIEVNMANVRARLLAKTLADERGTRLFNDGEVLVLGAKSGDVLDRLYVAARRHNRLTKEDVEELAGNSSAGLSAGNGSGSLDISAPASASARSE